MEQMRGCPAGTAVERCLLMRRNPSPPAPPAPRLSPQHAYNSVRLPAGIAAGPALRVAGRAGSYAYLAPGRRGAAAAGVHI